MKLSLSDIIYNVLDPIDFVTQDMIGHNMLLYDIYAKGKQEYSLFENPDFRGALEGALEHFGTGSGSKFDIAEAMRSRAVFEWPESRGSTKYEQDLFEEKKAKATEKTQEAFAYVLGMAEAALEQENVLDYLMFRSVLVAGRKNDNIYEGAYAGQRIARIKRISQETLDTLIEAKANGIPLPEDIFGRLNKILRLVPGSEQLYRDAPLGEKKEKPKPRDIDSGTLTFRYTIREQLASYLRFKAPEIMNFNRPPEMIAADLGNSTVDLNVAKNLLKTLTVYDAINAREDRRAIGHRIREEMHGRSDVPFFVNDAYVRRFMTVPTFISYENSRDAMFGRTLYIMTGADLGTLGMTSTKNYFLGLHDFLHEVRELSYDTHVSENDEPQILIKRLLDVAYAGLNLENDEAMLKLDYRQTSSENELNLEERFYPGNTAKFIFESLKIYESLDLLVPKGTGKEKTVTFAVGGETVIRGLETETYMQGGVTTKLGGIRPGYNPAREALSAKITETIQMRARVLPPDVVSRIYEAYPVLKTYL